MIKSTKMSFEADVREGRRKNRDLIARLCDYIATEKDANSKKAYKIMLEYTKKNQELIDTMPKNRAEYERLLDEMEANNITMKRKLEPLW